MFRYFRDICTGLGQGGHELGEATGEEAGASKEPCRSLGGPLLGAHPSFFNGGHVAMAAWSHGVRLLDISSQGKPREVAYFMKDVQAAVDVEWATDRILYVVEDGSGGAIDILRYTGPLPKPPGPLS